MADTARRVSEQDGRWTLQLRRTFRAPLSQVYRAFADPARLAQWFGSERYEAVIERFDFRVGGRWRIRLDDGAGEVLPVGGRFTAIEEGRRISMTWLWDHAGTTGVETEVTFAFAVVDGGTELVLTHAGFPAEDNAVAHSRGWTAGIEHIARLVEAA